MIVSRRSFLKATLATSAVAAGGSSGCGNDVQAAPIVEVTVDDDPRSDRYGQIAVAVPEYPELAAAGGAVTLRIAALAPGDHPFTVPSRGILLVHRGTVDDPPEFIATRSDCPHQGCPLGYSAKDQQIECPCHGSRFRAVADAKDQGLCVGLVTHLPARSNLAVYGAARVGDHVYVDLMKDLSCDALNGFPSVSDGTVTVPIAQFPELGTVGGSVIGKPAGLNDKLIVARVAADQVIALSAICTHMQCDVQLVLEDLDLYCGCHGSAYAFDGKVLAGPAVQPIKRYPVDFDGSTIVITVG